jgi:tetratricopeptide (TPR) repeat protein
LAEDLERFLAGEIPLAALEASSRPAAVADGGPPRPPGPRLFVALFSVLMLTAAGVAYVAAKRRGLLATQPTPTPPPTAVASAPQVDVSVRLAAVLDAARAGGPTDEVLHELEAMGDEVGDDVAATAQLTLATAELLVRRGRYAEALAAAQALQPATGEPNFRRLWVQGSALDRLNRQGPALESYDALAEYDPHGAWGLTAASAAARLRGDPEEALRLVRAAQAADPDHVPALIELSLLTLLLHDDRARAEGLLRRAQEHAPDHSRVFLGLATVLRQGREAEALELLDQAVAMTAPQAEPRLQAFRARLRLEAGELDGALADVEAVLEREPRRPDALFMRGMVHWRSQRRPLAKADWERCYDQNPSVFRQLLGSWPDLAEQVRARQVLRMDESGVRHTEVLFKVDDALRDRLAERAKWAGDGARGPLTEALVKAAEGFPWSEIAPHFEAALEAAPRSRVVALEQVRVLVGREEYDLALTEIQRARDLGADPHELKRLEGEVWWTRGKRHIAAERYWDALVAEDQGLEGLCATARTLGARSEVYEKDAWDAVEQALRLDPDHAPSLIAKGILIDPTENEELTGELQQLYERVLELQGYLDAQVFHLRLTVALAPLADDQTLDEEDRWIVDKALQIYDEWALVSSGVTHLLMASQLSLPVPGRDMRRRTRRYLQEAHALDPKRGSSLMYLGFLELITGKKPPPEEEVLDYWQRAVTAEPKITIPPDWIEIYRERYRDTSRLDALGIPAGER